DGQELLCIDGARGRRGRRLGALRADAGTRLPIYCTAPGKLLLAHLPAGEQRALLGELQLQRRGPRTILSKRALRAELEAIPEEIVATADEELGEGVVEIAAPV